MIFLSGQPIFQDKIFGNVSDFNLDVLRIYHQRLKVKVFNVDACELPLLHEMTVSSMSLMSSNDAVLVPALLELKIRFSPL
jgi:hypothetical protein